MSPIVITVLVLVGIALLVAIGYINHLVENRKLEQARLKADLSDRCRRCADVSESLPGQFMSPALKLLLSGFELNLSERLLAVDKQNPALKQRMEELRGLVAKGEAIPVKNAPQPILTEAKAKDVRFLFEALHAQLTRCAQDNMLPRAEAQKWVKEIRHLLTLLHIEFFGNLGQQALQQGQPRQARLAFERGAQYLQKQPEIGRYQAQLKQMEAQLAHANALVLETSQPAADEQSELGDGLKALDEDDIWKKKNLYD
ncbi:hypothetical protein N5J43_14955 [Pseudomonas nicosulfuronedens]|uniref:DNA repair protein n=1 Tax=Pseudomonas nicosulfuronedens TaxID=2571105 RepID=A0A5R9RQ04_9PSED|nr:hypothetical protein [Pseudomonas nicosulfuronedens]MDH1010266.1 hypothetical protein [Pseudomonas nicosulfuronedens]MDH1980253.1 hypothetical protein [Pseudomonas nicosulfuronedens]MDH2025501.1 hypothetical protein [Pseudomonas nicosulfuronedens]TLX78904.1 hypothetical protein FAS41_10240 [Pseudomonas nicosulfuronedens]